MDYATSFSVHLDTRHYSLGGEEIVALFGVSPSRTIEKGASKQSGGVYKETIVTLPVADKGHGYVEAAIRKGCEMVRAADLERFWTGGRVWLIVRLFDADFIELHLDSALLKLAADTGVQIAIENRSD